MQTITRQILILGFYLLVLAGAFSSYTTLLNYVHKAHGSQHQYHSTIFFTINALSVIFFNFLVPSLAYNNLKMMALIYGLMYFINYVLTLLGFLTHSNQVIVIFTIIGAVITGLGNCLLGLVSGKYVNKACEKSRCKQQQGRYYGILGSLMAANFFVGAVLSTLTYPFFEKKHGYYIVLSLLTLFAIILAKFFLPDIDSQQDISNSIDAQMIQKDKKSLFKDFTISKLCLLGKLSHYRRMLPLLPFQISQGIFSGYILHCLEDLVYAPQKADKDKYFIISLIFLGIGGILGAYIAGFLSDRIGAKRLCLISMLSVITSYFLAVISLDQQILFVTYLTSLISGFSMMFLTNFLVVACSKYYGGSFQTFAQNRNIINISFLLYNVGINVIDPSEMRKQMFYQLGIFMLYSVICIYLIKYLREKPIKKYENEENKDKMNFELNQVEMEIQSDRTAKIQNNSNTDENNSNQPYIQIEQTQKQQQLEQI